MGRGGIKAAMEAAVPYTAMIAVEGCIIILTIMASTTMARGMSPFVFVVYTNAIASILLLPYSFFYHRDRWEEPFFTIPFVIRMIVLGFIGVTIAQNLAFVGLSYSSPIVAISMANQIPAMSFILGIILRRTRFEWRNSGWQARIIGTLISITGAITVTLYKGPTVRNNSYPSIALRAGPPRLLVFSSPHENWVLGCILFAASSFILVIWNFFQVGAVKLCSQVMKILSFYSLFGTIQSAVLAVYLERDPNAWRLDLNFELLVIVLTAIFSSMIRVNIQMWGTKLKGAYFVPLFKPFGILFACTFGCLFFSETFHYGSMMGAFICGVGYYTVLWGQIKDEEQQKSDQSGKVGSLDEKEPLLKQEDSQV